MVKQLMSSRQTLQASQELHTDKQLEGRGKGHDLLSMSFVDDINPIRGVGPSRLQSSFSELWWSKRAEQTLSCNNDEEGAYIMLKAIVPQTQGCALSSGPPQKACGRRLHRQTIAQSMPASRILHMTK